MLKVPVGLIVTSWGGSACEAWLSPDWLKAFPTVKLPVTQAEVDKTKQRCPSALYNGMLHPLIGMRIAGVIWYQGEDNWPRYQNYADLFSTMVRGWRKEFGQGDFPFYYCQIAPYDYTLITAEGQDTICSAFLREQQLKAEDMIPNSGMAVLMIFVALAFRAMGVCLCLLGTNLNAKERIFCVIAYLPKATVQAAIGSVPLSLGLPCGKIVLSVAVLAILITAPLGAIGIDRSYQKLLMKE